MSGIDRVSSMLHAWLDARVQLAEIERAEHPNITDIQGRVWTWWKGDLYRTPRPDLYPVSEYRAEVGQSALPLAMIRISE